MASHPRTRGDSRMYRATFKTFEAYCQERWEFSKRQCDRLINAAKVTDNLGPIGPKPTSESQARPLAKLPAEAVAKETGVSPAPIALLQVYCNCKKPPQEWETFGN